MAEVASLRAELAQARAERDSYKRDALSNCAIADAALARAEQAEKELALETARKVGHGPCREVEQKLREANRRLQQEGPALERDKVIVALRARAERAERLIKQVEWYVVRTTHTHCPWCQCQAGRVSTGETQHKPDCPAFGQQTSATPQP